MNDVRMPIVTTREGNKITKICVEDVYKIINRVENAIERANFNSQKILEDIKNRKYWSDNEPNTVYKGSLIKGTGVSQPCLDDAFDEEIGNNIAFIKAKLNANIKKHNFLCRVYNEFSRALDDIEQEINKIDDYIVMDLNGVRTHNPEYLLNIEEKLGIYEI